MTLRRLDLALALALACGWSVAARADIVTAAIGLAANASAASRNQERGCMDGSLGAQADIGPDSAAIAALMGRYAAAAATADAAALNQVFARSKGGGWYGHDGLAAAGHIRDPSATWPLSPRILVFARDGDTARGVWDAQAPAGDPPPTAVYVADFQRAAFSRRWRIWRMRVYSALDIDVLGAPPLPQDHCHAAQLKPLWGPR